MTRLYPPLPEHEQIRKPYRPPPGYWDESVIPLAKDEPVPKRGKGRWTRAKCEKEGGTIVEQVLECVTKHGPINTQQLHGRLPGASERSLRSACSDLVVEGKIVYSDIGRMRIYRIRNEGEEKGRLKYREGSVQERIMEALRRKPWLTTAEIKLRIGGGARSTAQVVSLLYRRGQIERRNGDGGYEYAAKEPEGESEMRGWKQVQPGTWESGDYRIDRDENHRYQLSHRIDGRIRKYSLLEGAQRAAERGERMQPTNQRLGDKQ